MTIASVPEGVQVFEHAASEPVPPGRQEGPLRLNFSLVGAFRARVYEHGGRLTSVDDHLFSVHPVIERDFQGILYSRHGELQEPLPAERVWLPWANEKSWYADPPAGLTVTDTDAIYVTASDGTSLLRTRDGGRTWDVLEVEFPVLTVLRNGALDGPDRRGRRCGALSLDGRGPHLSAAQPLGRARGRTGGSYNRIGGRCANLADRPRSARRPRSLHCVRLSLCRRGRYLVGGVPYLSRRRTADRRTVIRSPVGSRAQQPFAVTPTTGSAPLQTRCPGVCGCAPLALPTSLPTPSESC